MIEVVINYSPTSNAADEIRGLFCEESIMKPVEGRNPLIETKFNALLSRIAQEAFNEGRAFKLKDSTNR
jgi:hypothetical protein